MRDTVLLVIAGVLIGFGDIFLFSGTEAPDGGGGDAVSSAASSTTTSIPVLLVDVTWLVAWSGLVLIVYAGWTKRGGKFRDSGPGGGKAGGSIDVPPPASPVSVTALFFDDDE